MRGGPWNPQPDRVEQCVMFWDTETNDRYAKYVKKLISIRACGEYCVLATKVRRPHARDAIPLACDFCDLALPRRRMPGR